MCEADDHKKEVKLVHWNIMWCEFGAVETLHGA